MRTRIELSSRSKLSRRVYSRDTRHPRGTRKETLHGFFFFAALSKSTPYSFSFSLLRDSRIVGIGRSFVPAGLDEVLVAAARNTHTPTAAFIIMADIL